MPPDQAPENVIPIKPASAAESPAVAPAGAPAASSAVPQNAVRSTVIEANLVQALGFARFRLDIALKVATAREKLDIKEVRSIAEALHMATAAQEGTLRLHSFFKRLEEQDQAAQKQTAQLEQIKAAMEAAKAQAAAQPAEPVAAEPVATEASPVASAGS